MSEVPSQPEAGDPALMEGLREAGSGSLMFGRFRLERELGHGGMGVVWLARDERLRMLVALKFLPGLIARDEEALEDLRREITHAILITHPGVVRVHDLHVDPATRTAAIAMEYVDGPTLAELKAAQPDRCFDPADLLPWLPQLCDTLNHLHERKRLVHRDLKPRNLMLTSAGELKVTDFGIAAAISDSHSRLTQHGPTSGTPAYMSPQQTTGRQPRPTDDIYGLGATLYDLLAGKPPFFRGPSHAIIHQLLSEPPVSIAERRAELGITGRGPVPPAWEEAIAACLAKEPEERPASARALLERLTEAPPPVPSVNRSPPSPAAEALPRKQRAMRGGILLCSLVVVIALGAWWWRIGGTWEEHAPSSGPASSPAAQTEANAAAPDRSDRPVTTATPLPQTAADATREKLGALVQQGKAARTGGDPALALAKLHEAEVLDPLNAEILAELALSYEQTGAAEKAVELWRRVTALGPGAGVYAALAQGKLAVGSPASDGVGPALDPSSKSASSPPAPGAIAPPFGLKWGEAAERLERMLNGAKAKIVQRQNTDVDCESWDVEGLTHEGLQRTEFSFRKGQLQAVELRYHDPTWDAARYRSVFEKVGARLRDRYGPAEPPEVPPNAAPAEIHWRRGNTALVLRTSGAEATPEARFATLRYEGDEGASRAEWTLRKVDGVDYVSFQEISRFYGLGVARLDAGSVVMDFGTRAVRAKPGSSELFINKMKFHLSRPVLEVGGFPCMSRMDLVKLVEPVLRPGKIKGAGAVRTVILEAMPAARMTPGARIAVQHAEDVAARARALFVAAGFQVESAPAGASSKEKIAFANKMPDALLLAISFQSQTRHEGIETVAFAPRGVPATGDKPAESDLEPSPANTCDAQNSALATAVHAAVLVRTRVADGGVKRGRHALMRDLSIPAVMVRPSEIGSAGGATQIAKEAFRQEVAESLVLAVKNYQRATSGAEAPDGKP